MGFNLGFKGLMLTEILSGKSEWTWPFWSPRCRW